MFFLLKQIMEACNDFEGPVTGPVALYLRAAEDKEDEFEVAKQDMVSVIGDKLLNSVIVTNHHDLTLARSLLSKNGFKWFGIFAISPKSVDQKYKVSDPGQGTLTERFTSSMDVENVMVYNYILDKLAVVDYPNEEAV